MGGLVYASRRGEDVFLNDISQFVVTPGHVVRGIDAASAEAVKRGMRRVGRG